MLFRRCGAISVSVIPSLQGKLNIPVVFWNWNQQTDWHHRIPMAWSVTVNPYDFKVSTFWGNINWHHMKSSLGTLPMMTEPIYNLPLQILLWSNTIKHYTIFKSLVLTCQGGFQRSSMWWGLCTLYTRTWSVAVVKKTSVQNSTWTLVVRALPGFFFNLSQGHLTLSISLS